MNDEVKRESTGQQEVKRESSGQPSEVGMMRNIPADFRVPSSGFRFPAPVFAPPVHRSSFIVHR
jgi:hypothetical protein